MTWIRRWWPDLLALSGYLAGACVVLGRLLADPTGRAIEVNRGDDAFFRFVLTHGAKVARFDVDPFFTDAMNYPDGVNLMANTVVLGLGVPLAPITLLWGPGTTIAVLFVLGLAGTAFGWYWLLSRHLVSSKLAAGVGGALCGFGPGMVSHANGHPNWTAQFLVPLLILWVLRLIRPGHAVRDGLVLGLLITYQAFINEEVLLYTALAIGVFLLSRWVFAPKGFRPPWRDLIGGLAVAAGSAAVLLAYPLWRQFYGAQSYHGLPDSASIINTDLAAFTAFPRLSLAGDATANALLAANATEENTFFGWPLLLVLAVAVIGWLYRQPTVRALLVTGAVFALLTLGTTLTVNGEQTSVTLPWSQINSLPLLEHVVPSRLGLVVLPVLGVLLALTLEAILRTPSGPLATPLRWLALVAVALALVPLIPLQVPVAANPPPPEFITSGQWRQYLPHDKTLVTVPLAANRHQSAMRWWAATGGQFRFAGGYFLGPDADGKGKFGPVRRPTQQLFDKVDASGEVPEVTERMRADLRADLAYWQAGLLVLPDAQTPGLRQHGALNELMVELLGPGTSVGGVTIWQVPSGVPAGTQAAPDN